MNQVAKDTQLFDIAKDCFQFVTKFFEVINVSAAHIYHSALELCPVSSIIRKLYYHCRITRSPKIAIGILDSWDPTIAISGKHDYQELCTWSPCGRFVAAQTRQAVEIRNQLTLELITILQPTDTGGEGAYTQQVHCGFIVGSETICPPQTQWVSGGFF